MDRSTPIEVLRDLDSSVSNTWAALTELTKMTDWFFEDIPAFEPVVGFETEFLVESEGRRFTHKWKILEVDHERSITYQWCYTEYPGMANVQFELKEKLIPPHFATT